MEENGGSARRVRKAEEEDEHVMLSIRIATEFLSHVYLPAHVSITGDRGLPSCARPFPHLLDPVPPPPRLARASPCSFPALPPPLPSAPPPLRRLDGPPAHLVRHAG